jgi:predicted enzyme related to lactoylglutathione lyase
MIRGVHTMFYSSQADELRVFLRDTLGLSFTDVGGGWLIFDLPDAEMGVHPADEAYPHAHAGTHNVSFYCDDVTKTVEELKAKGVEFTQEPKDESYGIVTHFNMPGGVTVQLYQPQYKRLSVPRPLPESEAAAAPRAKAAARKKPSKKKAAPKSAKKKAVTKTGGKKKAAKKKSAARKR